MGSKIRALLSDIEFEHLLGNLKELCIFATKTIAEPATTIKTGARHSHAKYLLFPVRLRRQFRCDEFDFENIACGTVLYPGKVYVLYGVSRKGAVVHPSEPNHKSEPSSPTK